MEKSAGHPALLFVLPYPTLTLTIAIWLNFDLQSITDEQEAENWKKRDEWMCFTDSTVNMVHTHHLFGVKSDLRSSN